MQSFVCPVCGGKRHIVIETGLAVFEACGKTFDAEAEDVQKYGEILRDAERLMRQNTVAGYEDAIRLLASIPFVSGAKEKQTECEKRLSELQTRKRRRMESEQIGYNGYDQCYVPDERDIVAIAAGSSHTVGLRSDGTVAAVGYNYGGQCNVSGWTDIVAISAGGRHTVGLRLDGTVVAVGNNGDGQCSVSGWTDIVAIAAGYRHTVGLRSDGTVAAVGANGSGQCDVSGWRNIRLPDAK